MDVDNRKWVAGRWGKSYAGSLTLAAMALVYLLYPTRHGWDRRKLHWLDGVLAVLAAASPLYIVQCYEQLVTRAGAMTTVDVVVGTLGVFFVLEAARRVVGKPIVIVVSLFLAYAFIGPLLPGIFAHQGVDLYFTTEGVFGIPLGVSSTFIFLFILWLH